MITYSTTCLLCVHQHYSKPRSKVRRVWIMCVCKCVQFNSFIIKDRIEKTRLKQALKTHHFKIAALFPFLIFLLIYVLKLFCFVCTP